MSRDAVLHTKNHISNNLSINQIPSERIWVLISHFVTQHLCVSLPSLAWCMHDLHTPINMGNVPQTSCPRVEMETGSRNESQLWPCAPCGFLMNLFIGLGPWLASSDLLLGKQWHLPWVPLAGHCLGSARGAGALGTSCGSKEGGSGSRGWAAHSSLCLSGSNMEHLQMLGA